MCNIKLTYKLNGLNLGFVNFVRMDFIFEYVFRY